MKARDKAFVTLKSQSLDMDALGKREGLLERGSFLRPEAQLSSELSVANCQVAGGRMPRLSCIERAGCPAQSLRPAREEEAKSTLELIKV